MPRFFIDRPVFAWVLAIFICLAGILTIPQLPVAQYPIVAPPTISISTSYPGASSENLYQSVTRLIEEELNGAQGIQSFESTSDALGQVDISATFVPGTDLNAASVEVQNRLKRIEARLPPQVRQQGIIVEEASAATLQLVTLRSTNGALDEIGLGDFLTRNVIGELRRIPGVGRAVLYSTERSLRVWIDPDKLIGRNLTTEDVTGAIAKQNSQVGSGSIGAQPSPLTQATTAPVVVKGQLSTPEEFGAIVLRANPDGSTVRLRDVARIEVGGLSYQFSTRLNGKDTASISILLAPNGNALATARAVRAKLTELANYFPEGVAWEISYDVTPVVIASIKKVLTTLLEAAVLVFLVMLLFLQNIRYTLIPTLVVPVALLGTCAVLYAAGFSINVMTMFGMVLAIGILVDDAIVVVENVERIMSEEGLSPKDATRKAMGQITGAIIGITLVLIAVFIPMAFFPGSVGIIYRQFSISITASIAISAVLALSLTPALCATILKPVPKGHAHARGGFFGWFNRGLARFTAGYGSSVAYVVARGGRVMLVYAVLVGAVAYGFARLPSGFLPVEDQGFLLTDIQTPADASLNRTLAAVEQTEKFFLGRAGIDNITVVNGYSFSGQGQNTSQAFVTLKDWSERDKDSSAAKLIADGNAVLSKVRDANIKVLAPPPIDNLGNTSGFSFRLQDRGQRGYASLISATDQLLDAAKRSPLLQNVSIEGLPPGAQVELVVDREKASAFGVRFEDINDAITTNLGSNYVNDFPNRGRMQRVVVQSDQLRRMNADDLLKLFVRNVSGAMVPLSSVAQVKWSIGPTQLVGFNNYPAVRLTGEPKHGVTTGQAMSEMERLAGQLPRGIGYEWTGQSLQEKLAGSTAILLLALSILFVFLCLAALYESWTIPLAVLLVVPLGVLGSIAAAFIGGLPNDVYFKIALITIIGLSAKNAILIIEFAKDLRAQGRSLVDATLEASTLRLRPILMTSFAFILGVLPLVIASGASSKSSQAIGTGVLGGMITATILAVIAVPVFFVVVMRVFTRRKPRTAPTRTEPVPAE